MAADRDQLRNQVVGHVREQIMRGEYRPGDFLRTARIANDLGVSVTPVREGLVLLSAEGFVAALPRRGFMVAEFTRQDVRDLFWSQAQLAAELAARAARHIGSDELAALDEIQRRWVAAVAAADVDAISREGHQFHRVINRAARSERLARLLAGVVGNLPNHFYASLEGHVSMSTGDHIELHVAIAARDDARAADLMRQHIVGGADVVIEMLEERGLWGDSAPVHAEARSGAGASRRSHRQAPLPTEE